MSATGTQSHPHATRQPTLSPYGGVGVTLSRGECDPRMHLFFSRAYVSRDCEWCGVSFRYALRDRQRSGAGEHVAVCVSCRRSFRYVQITRPRIYCFECGPVAATRGPRKCKGCGGPPISPRHWYCAACREKMNVRRRGRSGVKASTGQRGYGVPHRKLRAQWAARVARGGIRCARCDRVIPAPGSGEPCPGILAGGRVCGKINCGWHLGHVDGGAAEYRGPEHQCCNVGAPKRGKARQPERSERSERSGRW
jgi:hypothetical protein